MRYALLAVGLLAACQTVEPAKPAGPDYSSMSCDQLLRTRAALEREAAVFAGRAQNDLVTQGMIIANPGAAMVRGMNDAAIAGANMAYGAQMGQSVTLRAKYREVNAAIIERGC